MTSFAEGQAREEGMNGSQRDESAELYRLLVATVRDYAIFALDATGHVLTWNAGAEHLKGYKASEIIGRHFSVFYPPEDVAAGKPGVELVGAARDGRFEDEGWRVRKDGTRFWANVIVTALGTIRAGSWDSQKSRAISPSVVPRRRRPFALPPSRQRARRRRYVRQSWMH